MQKAKRCCVTWDCRSETRPILDTYQNQIRVHGEDELAKKSMIAREKNRKYPTRVRNRCRICGRPRAYMRRFGMCRICFRELASEGMIPGVTKSSW